MFVYAPLPWWLWVLGFPGLFLAIMEYRRKNRPKKHSLSDKERLRGTCHVNILQIAKTYPKDYSITDISPYREKMKDIARCYEQNDGQLSSLESILRVENPYLFSALDRTKSPGSTNIFD